jgi:hypothetical protein
VQLLPTAGEILLHIRIFWITSVSICGSAVLKKTPTGLHDGRNIKDLLKGYQELPKPTIFFHPPNEGPSYLLPAHASPRMTTPPNYESLMGCG